MIYVHAGLLLLVSQVLCIVIAGSVWWGSGSVSRQVSHLQA